MRGSRQRERLLEFVERDVALGGADRRDEQEPRRARVPGLAQVGVAVDLGEHGARHRDRPHRGRVRAAARGRERIDAVAGLEQRRQRDEVRRRHAVQNERRVQRRVGAHVRQGQRLGAALEVLEEGHMAGEVRDVRGGDAAAAVHAGQIKDAVLAALAHAIAHDAARAEHARDLFIGALEDTAPGIAHDGVKSIAEMIRLDRFYGTFQCLAHALLRFSRPGRPSRVRPCPTWRLPP